MAKKNYKSIKRSGFNLMLCQVQIHIGDRFDYDAEVEGLSAQVRSIKQVRHTYWYPSVPHCIPKRLLQVLTSCVHAEESADNNIVPCSCVCLIM